MATSRTWNPSLEYRGNRNPRTQEKTILEEYGEEHIVGFLRQYMPNTHPNHEYGPLVQAAARTAQKLAMFDDNNLLLDQVIFGIAHPYLCLAGIRDIAQDRDLVTLLLVRHFKKFGGLVLPPSKLARLRQEAHEQVVRAELAAQRSPGHMVYPVWKDLPITKPPYGRGRPIPSRGGRGGGNAGRGGGRGGPA